MEGGAGNDQYIGGDGDDIITDLFGDDIMRTGRGHDAVNAGQGVDLIVADEGQDFIVLGADLLDEAFGGVGNDFVYGSKTTEQTLGGEGDDWIEVGAWTGAVGDNFDDQFQLDAVKGHDVFHGDGGFDEFIGEGGDDIWFGSLGRGKFDGMSGYDWTTYDGMNFAVNVDLNTQILPGIPVLPADAALDSFTQVEGASGSTHNDVIRGSDVTAADMPTEGFRGSALDAEGIALITGLQALLAGAGPASFDAQGRFVGGNILLGGAGSDLIEGRGGDDIIDGDAWLRVRIAVMSTFDANGPTGNTVLSYHDSMTTLVSGGLRGHDQSRPAQDRPRYRPRCPERRYRCRGLLRYPRELRYHGQSGWQHQGGASCSRWGGWVHARRRGWHRHPAQHGAFEFSRRGNRCAQATHRYPVEWRYTEQHGFAW